jgi:hypothetical protein
VNRPVRQLEAALSFGGDGCSPLRRTITPPSRGSA